MKYTEQRWNDLKSRNLGLMERTVALFDSLTEYKTLLRPVTQALDKFDDAARQKVSVGTDLKKAEKEIQRNEVNFIIYNNE